MDTQDSWAEFEAGRLAFNAARNVFETRLLCLDDIRNQSNACQQEVAKLRNRLQSKCAALADAVEHSYLDLAALRVGMTNYLNRECQNFATRGWIKTGAGGTLDLSPVVAPFRKARMRQPQFGGWCCQPARSRRLRHAERRLETDNIERQYEMLVTALDYAIARREPDASTPALRDNQRYFTHIYANDSRMDLSREVRRLRAEDVRKCIEAQADTAFARLTRSWPTWLFYPQQNLQQSGDVELPGGLGIHCRPEPAFVRWQHPMNKYSVTALERADAAEQEEKEGRGQEWSSNLRPLRHLPARQTLTADDFLKMLGLAKSLDEDKIGQLPPLPTTKPLKDIRVFGCESKEGWELLRQDNVADTYQLEDLGDLSLIN